MDTSHTADSGRFAQLAERYDGKTVSVYCINGARYVGSARFIAPYWIEVQREDAQGAVCNLEHVVAITKRD